jgi:hypothetical protein
VDPAETVLDQLVTSGDLAEQGRAGLVGRQAGDEIDRLGLDHATGDRQAALDDPDGLDGARER